MSLTDFTPDCYAITHRGIAMPAQLVSRDGHVATVRSPQGREYAFSADALLPVDEAERQLKQDRVAFVASTYQFEAVVDDRRQTIIRCLHPTRKASSYVLSLNKRTRALSCTCPAYGKSAGHVCKHTEAYRVRTAVETGSSCQKGEGC